METLEITLGVLIDWDLNSCNYYSFKVNTKFVYVLAFLLSNNLFSVYAQLSNLSPIKTLLQEVPKSYIIKSWVGTLLEIENWNKKAKIELCIFLTNDMIDLLLLLHEPSSSGRCPSGEPDTMMGFPSVLKLTAQPRHRSPVLPELESRSRQTWGCWGKCRQTPESRPIETTSKDGASSRHSIAEFLPGEGNRLL